MDTYKITDAQMDALYQVKTAMRAASLLADTANQRNNDMTPLVEFLAQLARQVDSVLIKAELLPDAQKDAESVRVI